MAFLKEGYENFKIALEKPTTLNGKKAKNFISKIFPEEFNDKWEELKRNTMSRKSSVKYKYLDYSNTASKQLLEDLGKDPHMAKKRITYNAISR